MKLLTLLLILTLVSTATAFDISSTSPSPGERVTISGTADPGQSLRFRSSFEMSLPVTSGKYEYEASSVEIPQTPNRFSVSARGVKDLNVGVRIGIWITKRFTASNGAAYVSQSDVPPGRYNLKIFGEAQEGANSVSMDVTAETTVQADSDGKYSLSLDTSGIAAGAYTIEGAGDTKVIQVGGEKGASSVGAGSGTSDYYSGGGGDRSPQSLPPSQVEITPEVIAWYATEIKLDPKTPEQYSDAEKKLQYRLSGGYWKVIARGAPLTESAGDCEEKFCLVRGVDACTSCREEEIRQLSIEEARKAGGTKANYSSRNESNVTLGQFNRAENGTQDKSLGEFGKEQNKGFVTWIIDLILKLLGLSKGG